MYVFDAHCDYLWIRAQNKNSQIDRDKAEQVKLQKSIFAVFEGSTLDDDLIDAEISAFYGKKPIDDVRIAFEGLSWIKSLKDAEKAIRADPVYVGPVWNKANGIGGSCYENEPLSIFGRCVLREFEENGVYIDLAHSGERTFDACADEFEKVLFSHGNVSEIYSHPRNLKREQIKKLISKNSFFGLSLYTGFVGSQGIEKLFEHIEYVLDMGGEKILGFGSDLDGCESIVGRTGDVRVFFEIIEEFYKRNYNEKLIKALLHKNLERCIEKN